MILYHCDGTQTIEQVYTVTGGAIVATPVGLGSSTDKPYLFLFVTGFEAAGTAGVTVTIGGTNASVTFAGSQGGFAGLDQANVQLPSSLAGKGNVPIQLRPVEPAMVGRCCSATARRVPLHYRSRRAIRDVTN